MACVFLMTTPFGWYHKFLITRHWPLPLTYIWKMLTLHITCLEWDIGLSYGASVFFMIRRFWLDYKFWSCDLDRDLWPTFEKTLTLHITILPWDTGLSYSILGNMCFSFTPCYFAIIYIKDRPGCLFTLTFLLKSSYTLLNMLECLKLHASPL